MDGELFLLLLIVCNIEAFNLNPSYVCNEYSTRSDNKIYTCTGGSYCRYVYKTNKTVTCSFVIKEELEQSINSWNIEDDTNMEDDTNNEYDMVIFKVMDSNITVWPMSAFKNKQKLVVLYLENLHIQKIMPGAFNYLDSLKEMHLKGNQLVIISEGIFNSLTNLETLDLSWNHIQNITDHALSGGRLNTLLLNNNNISQISQELINSLTDLQTLDVSHNRLREINHIHNLFYLNTLKMKNNELNTVDFALMSHVTSEIDLSFNNISELINFNLATVLTLALNNNNIRTLKENKHILNLDVTNNRLEAIGSDLFNTESRKLYFGTNSISTITANAFFGLKSLEYLTLDNNNLTSLPNSCFRDLVSLVLLDLSGNKLTHFTYGTFDNMVRLETLNISGNLLLDLQQNLFHALVNLRNLYFANNELSDINISDLSRMEYLRNVDLRGNIWNCKTLVNIIHILRGPHRQVMVYNGESWEESNIHGIKCYETSEVSTAEKKSDGTLDDSKLNRFYNEDFTKTIMYKFFNKEFKDSNFYKYLESLKNTINDTYLQNVHAKYMRTLIDEIKSKSNNDSNDEDFTKSAMYNYFNGDFRKSEFFKYFENFKDQEKRENRSDESQRSLENILEEFIDLLKNITTDKSTDLLSDKRENTTYNYFNKDFKNSSFFQYLENLNAHILERQSDNVGDSKMEKLIRTMQSETATNYGVNYTGLLSFIAILLVASICVNIATIYLKNNRNKKSSVSSSKENVELI